jgi:hypothetical protein
MSIRKVERRKNGVILFVAGFCLCSSGCSTLRSVEQWKCNRWGICHFGTTPQPQAAAPMLPPPLEPVYAPVERCEPAY